MKNHIILILLALGSFISQNSFCQNHKNEIEYTINKFFTAMQTKDTTWLSDNLKHATTLHSMVKSKDDTYKIQNETMLNFIKSVASIPENLKIEERLTSLKMEIDYPLAQVWTPYQFYINDKLSHTGTNAFVLIHENQKWKIIHIADTRRK